MNYIVFDLEWNQGNERVDKQHKEIPFEVIEIGAAKLNEQREIVSQFQALIRPQVYHDLHYMTRKLLHLSMKDLKSGKPFPEVMRRFFRWCGEDYRFCTWGPQDLTELQRNMRYYGMGALSEEPFVFYDVQKLFAIAYEEEKTRRTLEYAVDFLQIEKDMPFHRASDDAYYTALVFARIRDPKVLARLSYDTFSLPHGRSDEVHVVFEDYAKYISREFEDKTALLEDTEVISTRCYLCGRNLKRTVKWFTPNGRNYFSVSQCPEHGNMKGKLRIRKAEDGGVYAVKTLKFISPEEAETIRRKKVKADEQRQKRLEALAAHASAAASARSEKPAP